MSTDQISSNPSILLELASSILPNIRSLQSLQTFHSNITSGSLNAIVVLDQVVNLKANSPILILVTIQCAGMTAAGTSSCTVTLDLGLLPVLNSYMGTGSGCNFFPFITGSPIDNPNIKIELNSSSFYSCPSGETSIVTATIAQL
jgi:hypothetical protein